MYWSTTSQVVYDQTKPIGRHKQVRRVHVAISGVYMCPYHHIWPTSMLVCPLDRERCALHHIHRWGDIARWPVIWRLQIFVLVVVVVHPYAIAPFVVILM